MKIFFILLRTGRTLVLINLFPKVMEIASCVKEKEVGSKILSQPLFQRDSEMIFFSP